jgi:hypothetical protein
MRAAHGLSLDSTNIENGQEFRLTENGITIISCPIRGEVDVHGVLVA